MPKQNGAVGHETVDLTGAEAAEGGESAHKVHVRGPKDAKPTDFSIFD